MKYTNYDDWFKYNCRGCRNFFDCAREKKIEVKSKDLESCDERKPEW
jgi:hypothetical protein